VSQADGLPPARHLNFHLVSQPSLQLSKTARAIPARPKVLLVLPVLPVLLCLAELPVP